MNDTDPAHIRYIMLCAIDSYGNQMNVIHTDQWKTDRAQLAAKWIINHLLGYLNRDKLEIANCPIPEFFMVEFLDMIQYGMISDNTAKRLFEIMYDERRYPWDIAEEHNLWIWEEADETKLDTMIDDLLQQEIKKVEQIRAGKDKLVGWFIGQIMKATQGKADPKLVEQLILAKIQ